MYIYTSFSTSSHHLTLRECTCLFFITIVLLSHQNVAFTTRNWKLERVAGIVLLRDFTIVAGAGVYKLLYEEVEISPTFLSKANTATQLSCNRKDNVGA